MFLATTVVATIVTALALVGVVVLIGAVTAAILAVIVM